MSTNFCNGIAATQMLSINIEREALGIGLTIDEHRSKFVDTRIKNSAVNATTEVYCKTSKLPINCSSKVSKGCKEIAILGELHGSKRILNNFEMEIELIKRKFKNADYYQYHQYHYKPVLHPTEWQFISYHIWYFWRKETIYLSWETTLWRKRNCFEIFYNAIRGIS